MKDYTLYNLFSNSREECKVVGKLYYTEAGRSVVLYGNRGRKE